MRTHTSTARRAIGVALAATLVATPLGGCKPKKKSDPSAPAKDTDAMDPAPKADPSARPAAPAKGGMTPTEPSRTAAAPTAPTGDGAPPAALAAALGSAPEMALKANLAQWVASPLLKPLIASAAAGVQKEFGDCAKLFDLQKLKKAWFLQSSGRFIKKRRKGADPDPDSHYIAMSTALDLPALFACLTKSGKFKAVKLNGQAAWQATRKPTGGPTFWFAPTRDRLVIVDGAWAKKVTPGTGELGTGAAVDQVGDDALRAWGKNLAPDIKTFVARLVLADPVVLHASVTMRGEKEAAGAAHFLGQMKQHPMAKGALDAVKIEAKGPVMTIAYQAPLKDAQALAKLGELFFARGETKRAAQSSGEPSKEAPKAVLAPRAAAPKSAKARK